MNLQTARLLMPIERRQDSPQDRLTWLPGWLYQTGRKTYAQDEN